MKKTVLTCVFLTLIFTLSLQGVQVRDLDARNGESIAKDRCTICHDMGRIERAGYDRTLWQRTVQRMMQKPGFGSRLSDAEKEALIEYLVSL